MHDLHQRGIEICRSQVAFLAKKFIVYLALAHKQSTSAIKMKMHQRGGYILHLDGTSEGDSPHLMSILDGISQVVLDNAKVPSENAEYMETILNGAQSLEERFAQIDSELVRQELKKAEEENRKMHPKVRNIIKFHDLPEKIVGIPGN